VRALFVTNDYPPKPGGIQQYLANLVANHPGPVQVLAPREDAAVPEPHVSRSQHRFMWPTPDIRRWVLDEIERFTPDIVVYGAPHPLALLGPRIAQTTGVPYAVMTHGAEFLVPDRIPVIRQAVLDPIVRADVVFAVSDFTRRRVEAAAHRPVVRLGAGVDLETFHPPQRPPEQFVIGCVSRFVARKGHGRVIDAADRLYQGGSAVEVLIVGSGRLERRLRRHAAGAAVPVRFETNVPWERLPELYREMSIFAMPARTRWAGLEVEGLGIVYLEAAASGLPVIAGRSGGAPETVVEGETGWVAETTDEVADVLQRVYLDGSAVTAGAAARRLAEAEFGWDAVARRWRAAFDDIPRS
jgi:phosphatidylinositol alpha-1,6-mannosyltransferase